MIAGFTGRYAFLSNFFPAPVYIMIGTKWVKCSTVEHAYQASKTLDQRWRRKIIECATPADAKKMGNSITCVSYWEDVKRVIMLELLRQKFSRAVFARKLLRTGEHELVEVNNWHDNFWGVCACSHCTEHFKTSNPLDTMAENWLGRLLVRVRIDIRRA